MKAAVGFSLRSRRTAREIISEPTAVPPGESMFSTTARTDWSSRRRASRRANSIGRTAGPIIPCRSTTATDVGRMRSSHCTSANLPVHPGVYDNRIVRPRV